MNQSLNQESVVVRVGGMSMWAVAIAMAGANMFFSVKKSIDYIQHSIVKVIIARRFRMRAGLH